MSQNIKIIGVGRERFNSDGKRFISIEINMDEIEKAWIYEKMDTYKNTNVRKISVELSDAMSKQNKPYISVRQKPEWKKQNSDEEI